MLKNGFSHMAWLPPTFTGVGLIPLMVWLCGNRQMDNNRYGELPNMIF